MAVRPEAAHIPLQKGICRIRSDMMFEYTFDIRADHDSLHWVAQQVTHHAHSPGMRDFHEHREIGTTLPERRVGRMPDALPAEDPAAGFDLGPLRIKGVAAMTDPFGPKLPSMTMPASLHQEPVLE